MQTARWTDLVYGTRPPLDDPAETYHEASKISPTQVARQVEGARRLEASPHLLLSTTRAVKLLRGPAVALPAAPPPRTPFWETLEARRSARVFAERPLALDALASVLRAGYGITGTLDPADGAAPLPLRAVPSGGALYPLEIYAAALRVDGLEPGLYHFDPGTARLETVRHGVAPEEVAALSTYPQIVRGCAALLLVAAVFWRTRFKYGLRSYRFALLEAGHVGQNALLAATALGLGAVPLGGFYDRLADEFLGLDGVDESTLYTIAVGWERE